MLRIAKLTDYATVIMAELAHKNGVVMSAPELALLAGLESATVAKVLKSLAQARLVEGLRGINGGYRLVRPAQAITLADIIEAMEGPLAMTECSTHEGRCGIQHSCNARSNWQYVNRVVTDALRAVNLESMRAAPQPTKRKTIPAVLAEH